MPFVLKSALERCNWTSGLCKETPDAALRDLAASHAFDGVVNNVGLVMPQKLGEVELSALDEVLHVNLHPAVQAVQTLLPGMRARRVINVSSLTVLGAPERTAYAAAKAALVSFTRN